MALFRKLFYRKPPDGLLEISERVYVFDCCFTTEAWEEQDYKSHVGGIITQLREHYPEASILLFNFREGQTQSLIANAFSDYDITLMEYPRHYEGCPLLPMEVIHHFLRSGESWLSLGLQNVLLMHCERGGWPVLAFMLAALLIYRKQYSGEQKTLEMVYKQAPQELLHLLSPLNPVPSQLRYLQYISRRNVANEWPPLDRALTIECVIIRMIPNFDGVGGCRPIFRIYGQDPFLVSDRAPKVLFSTPKKSRSVRYYKQAECELVKIDINCHTQGDVVLECISLHDDMEREVMMFRVMFNTAFIRSNILMLNRDEIDVLWDAKDRFPKDFRAEVLFSEMDSAASVVPIDFSFLEEKDGLPVEAFARVQEIFNSVDWVSPKGDAAMEVLQQIAVSSNTVIETYSQAEKLQEIQNAAAVDYGVKKSMESSTESTTLPTSSISPSRPTIDTNIDPQRRLATSFSPFTPSLDDKIGFQGRPHFPLLPQELSSTSSPTLNNEITVGPSISQVAQSTVSSDSTRGTPFKPAVPPSAASSTEDVVTGPPATTSSPSSLHVFSTVDVDKYATVGPLPSVPTVPSSPAGGEVGQPSSSQPPSSPQVSSSTEDVSHKIVSPVSVSRVNQTPVDVCSTVDQKKYTAVGPLSPVTDVPTSPDDHQVYQASKGRLFQAPPSHVSSSTEDASHKIVSPLSVSRINGTPHMASPPTISSLKEKTASRGGPLAPPPPPPPPPHVIPTSTDGLVIRSTASVPPPPGPPLPSRVPLSESSSVSGKSLLVPPPPSPPPLPPPHEVPLNESSVSRKSSVVPPAPPPPSVIPQNEYSTITVPPPAPPPPRPSVPPSNEHSTSITVPPPSPPLTPPLRDKTATRSTPCIPPSPPAPPPPPAPPKEISSDRVGSPLPVPHPSGPSSPSPVAPPPPPPAPATPRSPSISSPPVPVAPPPFNSPKGSSLSGSPSPPPFVPPPGTKGKSLLSRTAPSKSNQTKKLKPLHWLKISRAVTGSLWAEAQKSGEASKAPEIDMSELESLFSTSTSNSDHGTGRKAGSRSATANKPEKVQLIEHRRAYNCEIMLSKIKIPLHELLRSVLALEDTALDVDQVDNVIKFCPTKEEMELLKGYKGEKDKLGKCEQFFLELMQAPRIESKLRVFSFKIQFHTQVSDLRNSLTVVNSATDQIRGSAKLRRIMQTILSLGNALNQGTARGSAIGFRLDSLLKLTETRARNNKITLMHYLCKVLADKLPELLEFWQDLSSLERASKIQLKYLAEEMQAINKGLEKVMQELAMSENDGPVSDRFRKALKEFLCFSESEVRSLASLYSGVGRNVDALILYFGEDPARCPFEQVISTLLNFVRMFKKAHEENCKQLELDKKKAEKEASTDKPSINASDTRKLLQTPVRSVK